MNREDFVALLTTEGQALLREVEYDGKTDLVKLVTKLRAAGHNPSLVAAVLSQAKLRKRAVAKFGEFAGEMLFTEPGLEQASRLNVAARHAARFRNAGVKRVADLGCGIGAESLALAAVDIEVSGFEIDEVTAAVATYNLNVFDNARVELADVTTLELGQFEGLFFDPARRELSGQARAQAIRKFDPAQFSPDFDWVVEQCVRATAAGIKVGPGHPHEAIPEAAEAQWVSAGGDLVELGLWFGSIARANVKRSALLLTKDSEGNPVSYEITSDQIKPAHAPLGELNEFIYEPDNAIVRSHLIGNLAEQTDTHSVSAEIAYLSSANEIHNPWMRGYRVFEDLAFDRKKLKALLRERRIGILEIKKRGADIVPEQLRKELSLQGENSATLIVTRVGEAHRALLCQAL